ncbi:MAG TPA: SLBB domain-containing protein [Chitinophagaceae bacterium]
MIKYLCCLALVFFLFIPNSSFSQDIFRTNNLREINVDQISDNDIMKYLQQLKAMGITQQQAEQAAISKGMPISEIQKLRQRIQKLNITNQPQNNLPKQGNLNQVLPQPGIDTTSLLDTTKKEIRPLIDPKIFGSELFNNTSLNFEPNLQIATPVNYELGPNDELNISVYGLQEISHTLDITPEGNITIPQVGEIKVAGQTIEEARQQIFNAMSNSIYPTLKNGRSKLSVTLGNIRSIRVTIIGANRPGNFTVPSLTSAFNALFLAGGPTSFGSFREIELIRNNKVFRKIDLYRFLVNGDQSDNVTLKDNDVIRIPSYNARVDIEGYVKRPGYFEVLEGETFRDLLKYSSGFSDSAYRASIRVTQFTDKELKVKDISANDYSNYQPQDGDLINVDKVLQRFSNRVIISGAVFRPGAYELVPGMTAGDLIKKADGLTEDAYAGRAQIFRLNEDLSKGILSFNALDVSPIPLKREDSLVVKSIFDLRDEYYVSVQGEVRKPDFYAYSDSLTLKDIILQAGGFTDAGYAQNIEVARLISRDTVTNQDVRSSEIININGSDDLSSQGKNIQLKPYDIITIRRKPGYAEMQSIKVIGEIQHPGLYVLEKREERVSDLLKRAGGFTPEAYKEGAFLKRYNDDTIMTIRRQTIENIQQQLNDSTTQVTNNIERRFDQIPLNIAKILSSPGSAEDVVLKARDELIVPKYTAEVKMSGSVLFPTQIPYDQKYDFKDYISSAGGFADGARKNKAYILYANGKAQTIKKFLFFKNYPTVKPGAEIIVPAKDETKNRLTTGEIIGISSALTSLAGVVIAILKL